MWSNFKSSSWQFESREHLEAHENTCSGLFFSSLQTELTPVSSNQLTRKYSCTFHSQRSGFFWKTMLHWTFFYTNVYSFYQGTPMLYHNQNHEINIILVYHLICQIHNLWCSKISIFLPKCIKRCQIPLTRDIAHTRCPSGTLLNHTRKGSKTKNYRRCGCEESGKRKWKCGRKSKNDDKTVEIVGQERALCQWQIMTNGDWSETFEPALDRSQTRWMTKYLVHKICA